ncbi:glycoside hydrolase family 73 protein [Clostridium sp. ZS2-4]|uniref:glycoside hydrolase family 73 protein n=1 Tax=Clostridium sp. ZS2-4 TaxID=2987703 RepID=UPI00227CAEBA|nr:glycoside hydrolase family 73 protein [Clostridium sp. ZS2-4]MCY6355708.1 glycoside hydrolase family 73 protein [Clostridium sp. ZS2-4]
MGKRFNARWVLYLFAMSLICSTYCIKVNAKDNQQKTDYSKVEAINNDFIETKVKVLSSSKSPQDNFIGKILKGAIESYNTYKVLPSVTIAQAILESGWGKSLKATKYNNLFGIKADKKWTGPKVKLSSKEYIRGKRRTVYSYWRVYNSLNDSIVDHGKFLHERPWYREAGVFKATNYVEQIKAVKKGGYCTDPEYVNKICRIINQYDLWQYDPNGKEMKF